MENTSIEDQVETLRGVITQLYVSNLDNEVRIIAIEAILAYYPPDVANVLISEFIV
ncbi:hypothetical protein LQM11_001234 [Vibrio parahaemolyticus]|nr:hypothetical protein [Vibrio parahaemolyticus]